MLILLYIFIVFIAVVPVAHWVLLTVNEEFFVFASFFIFIDLFGLTFAGLISDSLVPMQQRISLRFRTILEMDLAMQASLHASYIQLSQLVNVTTSIRKQYYEELYNLSRQRKMDIKLFTIQSKIVAYRILNLYELDLDRFSSCLTATDEIQDLRISLDRLPTGVGIVYQGVHLTHLAQTAQLVNNLEN
jgi:hypothetical protein